MSEITKACERPSCDNGKRYTLNANGIITAAVDCGDCSGTGRVPDVEGQLRAEVARLTADLSILAWERDSWRGSYERVIDPHNRAIVDLTATLAERDGEVARLEGREREAQDMLVFARQSRFVGVAWERSLDAWLAGCRS